MYPQVFGKYVLERELSRGGMARVVLATLRGAGGFEKRLVVKQIRDELSFDQQFVRRFVEEAKTTVALSHPNIVPVYELGVEQGTYFLAMELVEGCSVAELVREREAGGQGERRVLTPEEGAYVGMEVCRALDYAHRRMKVVHRDITPRNVMLDEEGQVKLIDFGIAAPARVAGHEILGSPGHMPPEQVDGKALGPPTDIFAVAVLLMEAWSGRAPFRRATPDDCDEAMRGAHPLPSDADPRLAPLDAVIARAMKLDPRERQQDAAELGRALRRFLQGTDVADIARGLGDRVHALRGSPSSDLPAAPSVGARAIAPSAGDLGTQTFAARDATIGWSAEGRREGRDPLADTDEGPAISTRRLDPGPSSDPPPERTPLSRETRETREAHEAREASRAKPAKVIDPALSVPTPLMVEKDVAAAIVRARAAREGAADGAAPEEAEQPDARTDDARGARSRRADTLATAPMETPVQVREPPRRGRGRLLAFAGSLVVVGLGFAAWRSSVAEDARGRAQAEQEAPSGVVSASPASSVPPARLVGASTSATATSATVEVSPPSPAPPSPAPLSAVAVSPSSAPALPVGIGRPTPAASDRPVAAAHAPSTASAARERALVTFIGEPGTHVSVDGAARGACPVRLSLEPGPHDARFRFDPTGESRSEGFSVRSGEQVTVRAEFTGVTPTVKVTRSR